MVIQKHTVQKTALFKFGTFPYWPTLKMLLLLLSYIIWDRILHLSSSSSRFFFHTKGFAHGNLNPKTILIRQSQPVRIKVAEFGLAKCIIDFSDNWRFGRRQTYKIKDRSGSSRGVRWGSVIRTRVLYFWMEAFGWHVFGTPNCASRPEGRSSSDTRSCVPRTCTSSLPAYCFPLSLSPG